MPFLEIESARLYYETHGSGPPLVFVHGLGGNHLSWWQQVPRFRDRYSCTVFAQRGFYPSGGEARPEFYGRDLGALLDHLGVEDAVLVGQSMGGWTCTMLALEAPSRVRALVLCDTVGVIRFPPELEARRPPSRDAELFARGVHPAAGDRMAAEQPALHHLYRGIDGLSPGVDKMALRRELDGLRAVPPERFADHAYPILWVWGTEDASIPVEAAELARETFPRARVELVPATGHSVYFERPDIFNALLEDFLAGL